MFELSLKLPARRIPPIPWSVLRPFLDDTSITTRALQYRLARLFLQHVGEFGRSNCYHGSPLARVVTGTCLLISCARAWRNWLLSGYNDERMIQDILSLTWTDCWTFFCVSFVIDNEERRPVLNSNFLAETIHHNAMSNQAWANLVRSNPSSSDFWPAIAWASLTPYAWEMQRSLGYYQYTQALSDTVDRPFAHTNCYLAVVRAIQRANPDLPLTRHQPIPQLPTPHPVTHWGLPTLRIIPAGWSAQAGRVLNRTSMARRPLTPTDLRLNPPFGLFNYLCDGDVLQFYLIKPQLATSHDPSPDPRTSALRQSEEVHAAMVCQFPHQLPHQAPPITLDNCLEELDRFHVLHIFETRTRTVEYASLAMVILDMLVAGDEIIEIRPARLPPPPGGSYDRAPPPLGMPMRSQPLHSTQAAHNPPPALPTSSHRQH